ncbi:MAG: hypothetical protein P8X74_13005 [Reinekea sp.]
MLPKNFNEPMGACNFEKQIKSSSYALHPLKKSRIQVKYFQKSKAERLL